MSKRKSKILLYDIEVTPNETYTWPQGRRYDLNAIAFKKSWEVLSIAYQFLGEGKVKVIDRAGQASDKQLLKRFNKIADSADILVTHNGKHSDKPRLRTRMTFHRIVCTRMNSEVDTCEVARRHFSFDGNSLGDLAEFLRVGKKLSNPGLPMWLGCMTNDEGMWKKMRRYNAHDVTLLRRVYKVLRPNILNHPNVALLARGDKTGCPKCGHWRVKSKGLEGRTSSVVRRLLCLRCGGEHTVTLAAAKLLERKS